MAIDLSAITSNFSASTIIFNVLVVVAALAALYAWGRARDITLTAIRGEFLKFEDNKNFGRRYERETRNRRYLDWKKTKGKL